MKSRNLTLNLTRFFKWIEEGSSKRPKYKYTDRGTNNDWIKSQLKLKIRIGAYTLYMCTREIQQQVYSL